MSFDVAHSGPVTRIERSVASANWDDLFSPSASMRRSTLARIGWAVIAGLTGIGGLASIGAGIFAPPENEEVSTPWGEDYAVDTVRAFFFLAAALGGAGAFSLWKASHRPGLGFWRATARPALLALCSTLFLAAVNFSANFSTGRLQWLGLIVMAVSTAGFLFFWLLRGPDFTPRSQDAYWGRALFSLFLVSGVVAGVGGARLFQLWRQEGYPLESAPSATIRNVPVTRWDRVERKWQTQERDFRFPNLAFDLRPIGSALLVMLTIGCLSEALYRRRVGRSAAGLSFSRTGG